MTFLAWFGRVRFRPLPEAFGRNQPERRVDHSLGMSPGWFRTAIKPPGMGAIVERHRKSLMSWRRNGCARIPGASRVAARAFAGSRSASGVRS
jgi:hypothetical protein